MEKMKKDLVTIKKKERMTVAKRVLQEKNIRHLPVGDGKKLIGLITNMGIRKAEASPAYLLGAALGIFNASIKGRPKNVTGCVAVKNWDTPHLTFFG